MSLLPPAMRIQDDFPFVLRKVERVVEKPVVQKPMSDWTCIGHGDNPPKRVRLYLNADGQEAEDSFACYMEERGNGCTCFISAPCGYCTHPGNPIAIEETDEFWEYGYES